MERIGIIAIFNVVLPDLRRRPGINYRINLFLRNGFFRKCNLQGIIPIYLRQRHYLKVINSTGNGNVLGAAAKFYAMTRLCINGNIAAHGAKG